MPNLKDHELVTHIQDAMLSAKKSIETAEQWFKLLGDKHELDLTGMTKKSARAVQSLGDGGEISAKPIDSEDEGLQVLYGVFDGQHMQTETGDTYPVPANYASKSKLVVGDTMKLIIQPNGGYVYKQIELAPRKLITGKLILDGNQYKILTEDKTYNVLYASVTFFRGKVGDNVTIIIPNDDRVCEWGAVENIIPE